jgi:hypothetical protein
MERSSTRTRPISSSSFSASQRSRDGECESVTNTLALPASLTDAKPTCRYRNPASFQIRNLPGPVRREARYYVSMRGEIREGFPIEDCAGAWAGHRRYTHVTWALFFCWIPYGALVFEVFQELLHLPNFVIPVIVPYVLALIIVSNLVSRFRCPRCGSRFYAWGPFGLGHNGFARKCRNCGLRKWKCDLSA